ncbi:MAG: hypothetical protein HQL18_03555, partial [Candidatus Omnitrophica bacterium]|nr:hypothetical protein [Candidatus Omnitrophota bacterium]
EIAGRMDRQEVTGVLRALMFYPTTFNGVPLSEQRKLALLSKALAVALRAKDREHFTGLLVQTLADDKNNLPARSRVLIKSFLTVYTINRPLTVTTVYAMRNEHVRLQCSADEPEGADALRLTVQQLDDLYGINPCVTWKAIAINDGNDSARYHGKTSAEVTRGYLARYFPDLLMTQRFRVIELSEDKRTALKALKGAAIVLGMRQAISDGADYVIYTDQDRATDLSQSGVLLAEVLDGQHDIAIANRHTGAVGVHRPWKRVIQHYGYQLYVKALVPLVWRVHDTQAAFKCFSKDILEQILPVNAQGEFDGLFEYGGAFDTNLLGRALKSKARLAQVATFYFEESDRAGFSKLFIRNMIFGAWRQRRDLARWACGSKPADHRRVPSFDPMPNLRVTWDKGGIHVHAVDWLTGELIKLGIGLSRSKETARDIVRRFAAVESGGEPGEDTVRAAVTDLEKILAGSARTLEVLTIASLVDEAGRLVRDEVLGRSAQAPSMAFDGAAADTLIPRRELRDKFPGAKFRINGEMGKGRIVMTLLSSGDKGNGKVLARLELSIINALAVEHLRGATLLNLPEEGVFVGNHDYDERQIGADAGVPVLRRVYRGLKDMALVSLFVGEDLRCQGLGGAWYDGCIEPYLRKCGFAIACVVTTCLGNKGERSEPGFWSRHGFGRSHPLRYLFHYETIQRFFMVKSLSARSPDDLRSAGGRGGVVQHWRPFMQFWAAWHFRYIPGASRKFLHWGWESWVKSARRRQERLKIESWILGWVVYGIIFPWSLFKPVATTKDGHTDWHFRPGLFDEDTSSAIDRHETAHQTGLGETYALAAQLCPDFIYWDGFHAGNCLMLQYPEYFHQIAALAAIPNSTLLWEGTTLFKLALIQSQLPRDITSQIIVKAAPVAIKFHNADRKGRVVYHAWRNGMRPDGTLRKGAVRLCDLPSQPNTYVGWEPGSMPASGAEDGQALPKNLQVAGTTTSEQAAEALTVQAFAESRSFMRWGDKKARQHLLSALLRELGVLGDDGFVSDLSGIKGDVFSCCFQFLGNKSLVSLHRKYWKSKADGEFVIPDGIWLHEYIFYDHGFIREKDWQALIASRSEEGYRDEAEVVSAPQTEDAQLALVRKGNRAAQNWFAERYRPLIERAIANRLRRSYQGDFQFDEAELMTAGERSVRNTVSRYAISPKKKYPLKKVIQMNLNRDIYDVIRKKAGLRRKHRSPSDYSFHRENNEGLDRSDLMAVRLSPPKMDREKLALFISCIRRIQVSPYAGYEPQNERDQNILFALFGVDPVSCRAVEREPVKNIMVRFRLSPQRIGQLKQQFVAKLFIDKQGRQFLDSIGIDPGLAVLPPVKGRLTDLDTALESLKEQTRDVLHANSPQYPDMVFETVLGHDGRLYFLASLSICILEAGSAKVRIHRKFDAGEKRSILTVEALVQGKVEKIRFIFVSDPKGRGNQIVRYRPMEAPAEFAERRAARKSVLQQVTDREGCQVKGRYKDFAVREQVDRLGGVYWGYIKNGRGSYWSARTTTGSRCPGEAQARRFYCDALGYYVFETRRVVKGREIIATSRLVFDLQSGLYKFQRFNLAVALQGKDALPAAPQDLAEPRSGFCTEEVESEAGPIAGRIEAGGATALKEWPVLDVHDPQFSLAITFALENKIITRAELELMVREGRLRAGPTPVRSFYGATVPANGKIYRLISLNNPHRGATLLHELDKRPHNQKSDLAGRFREWCLTYPIFCRDIKSTAMPLLDDPLSADTPENIHVAERNRTEDFKEVAYFPATVLLKYFSDVRRNWDSSELLYYFKPEYWDRHCRLGWFIAERMAHPFRNLKQIRRSYDATSAVLGLSPELRDQLEQLLDDYYWTMQDYGYTWHHYFKLCDQHRSNPAIWGGTQEDCDQLGYKSVVFLSKMLAQLKAIKELLAGQQFTQSLALPGKIQDLLNDRVVLKIDRYFSVYPPEERDNPGRELEWLRSSIEALEVKQGKLGFWARRGESR